MPAGQSRGTRILGLYRHCTAQSEAIGTQRCKREGTIRMFASMVPWLARLSWFVPLLLANPAFAANDVEVRHDISYREATSAACRLDIALPRTETGTKHPAIVVIHGGGWIEGDKSSFASADHGVPGNIVDFARLGFVAATINYRLSREAPIRRRLTIAGPRCDFYANMPRNIVSIRRGWELTAIQPAGTWPSCWRWPRTRTQLRIRGRRTALRRVQAAASDSGPLDLSRQYQQNQLRGVIEQFMGAGPRERGRASIAAPRQQITLSEKVRRCC